MVLPPPSPASTVPAEPGPPHAAPPRRQTRPQPAGVILRGTGPWLLFPALGPLRDGERAHRQAPSSVRGIFSSLKNPFPAQRSWSTGPDAGGDSSAKTTWIQEKTNNSLSSSWLPKFVPGFLEARLLVLVPGSGSSHFVTNPAPVLAGLARLFPAAAAAGGRCRVSPTTARPQKPPMLRHVAGLSLVMGTWSAPVPICTDTRALLWVTHTSPTRLCGDSGAGGSAVAAGVPARKPPRPARGAGAAVRCRWSFAPRRDAAQLSRDPDPPPDTTGVTITARLPHPDTMGQRFGPTEGVGEFGFPLSRALQ